MSEEDVVEGRTEFVAVNFDFDGIEVSDGIGERWNRSVRSSVNVIQRQSEGNQL